MTVLIVEDDFASRQMLKYAIEKENYECILADNGIEGLEFFMKKKPNVVITDVRMPQLDGLSLLENIRKVKQDTIIIIVTGHGNEELALKAFELGASNYLKKPIDLHELKIQLKQYSSLFEKKKITRHISDFIKKQQLELCIDNDINIVQSVVRFLVEKTGNFFNNKEQIRIELGLGELITNAIEHGNLGISYEEKKAALAKNNLYELYNNKIQDPLYSNRKIHIKYSYSANFCQWIIQDEGEGFNWKRFLYPSKEQVLNELNGRGIFISRLQFDELEYLEKGNIVQVKKYTHY
ncbi:MAG: response regulator [Bacteroidales bacterium]